MQDADPLQDKSHLFQLLVEGLVDYALYMLDPAGLVVSWNEGAHRINGYRADEVLGRHFSMFYTDQDRLNGLPAAALHHAAEHCRYSHEAQRVRKDGSVFWADIVLDSVRDETGRLIGFAKITVGRFDGCVFVLDDITQQKQLDAQLRQARKMEAVGQLTGGIAHDFNNLLAIIMGNLELLKEGPPDDPEPFELLEDALNAAIRGASLTHRLLAYSRQQPLAPSLTDIANLVKDMQSVLVRVLEESVEIRTAVAADLWSVKVDAHQLENALLNLALNARDAMPAGGVLAIAAENTMLDPAYAEENADVVPGPYVVVSVSDTGTGMSKETVERALEPFFTTNPVGRGTGLELSMVYGFVKQSGGHLKIYSELGYGTTVKLYLPQFTSSAARPPASAPDLAAPVENDRAPVARHR